MFGKRNCLAATPQLSYGRISGGLSVHILPYNAVLETYIRDIRLLNERIIISVPSRFDDCILQQQGMRDTAPMVAWTRSRSCTQQVVLRLPLKAQHPDKLNFER